MASFSGGLLLAIFDNVLSFHSLPHFDEGAKHSIDRHVIASAACLEPVDDIAVQASVNRQES